ncbi:MAG: riboflavin synthase, partial [Mongoliibacter sp.]
MFTGIIETIGTVQNITKEGSNFHIDIHSTITNELKIDQSVSHNGVCLTVVGIEGENYRVTA